MYTELDFRNVKARKNHICTLCGLRIPTGTIYISNPCLFEGDFNHNKYHVECRKEWEENCEPGEFDFPADFRKNARERIDFEEISGGGFSWGAKK